MKPSLWNTLYKLSLLLTQEKSLKTSTTRLSDKFGLAQQTVSRHLIILERLGLIERHVTVKGEEIKITTKGLDELRNVYFRLKSIFEGISETFIFEGRLFSGIGEAAYYMSLKTYRDQFIEKLGFDPYPGTLNLKLLSTSDVIAKKELEAHLGIEIESFKDKKRTYGSAKCFKAKINDKIDGAVVIVDRSHYNDSVLEVIAPVYIREKLSLKDGNIVRVETFAKTD